MSINNRRAFTLIEILVALVILGLLYAISLSVFNATYAGSQQQTMEEQIQLTLAAGLRVASLPGNHFTLPATTVNSIVLPSPLSISSSGAANGNAMSGDVVVGSSPSANVLLVAGYVNGTCTLGLVGSSEAMSWATTTTAPSACVAASFVSSIGAITGTKLNPAELTGS